MKEWFEHFPICSVWAKPGGKAVIQIKQTNLIYSANKLMAATAIDIKV